MTRVLHIFGRLNRGGAELRTVDILRRLGPADPKIEFLALSGLPGELDEEIRSRGSRVHYCRLDLGFPWRFARILRDRQIDVVHSHVYHFSGFVLRCAGRVGTPSRIAHFRSCSSGKQVNLRRWLQERLMRRWLDKWGTLILGNSEASLTHGWRSDWRSDPRCAVIHNGLDISEFKNITPQRLSVRREFDWAADCPLAIHVGRMDPAKNHERLLEIWAEMAARNPDWRFLSAGRIDQNRFPALKAKAAELSLQSKIKWAGPRTDIPRLLSAADTMIFPSLWEGLPGAVLEANAAGLGVIGSDIPPIREIAQHLDNIECVPLSSSSSCWSEVAQRVRAGSSRTADLRAFEKSVYGIDLCVRAHLVAWNDGSAHNIANVYASGADGASREAA